MTLLLTHPLSRLTEELDKSLDSLEVVYSPEFCFTIYALEQAKVSHPISNCVLGFDDSLRLDQAPILATMGYSLYLNKIGEIRPGSLDLWLNGLKRLSAREVFQRDRLTFFFRSFELLGIVLGAKTCEPTCTDEVSWLRQVLKDGEQKVDKSVLKTYFITAYAAYMIGIYWAVPVLPEVKDMGLDEAALLYWFCIAEAPFAEKIGILKIKNELSLHLLTCCLNSNIQVRDPIEQVLFFISFKELVNELVNSSLFSLRTQSAKDLIIFICRRFHIFARKISDDYRKGRQGFKIQDEYDVQHILHGLLKVHFDDVRLEEPAPSYGGLRPRLDFLLKKEKIVVETKMTRQSLKQKEVAEELIQDKEIYRSHPDYNTLICLVYDPGGYCNNPDQLESDLSGITDGLEVCVVVVPKGA